MTPQNLIRSPPPTPPPSSAFQHNNNNSNNNAPIFVDGGDPEAPTVSAAAAAAGTTSSSNEEGDGNDVNHNATATTTTAGDDGSTVTGAIFNFTNSIIGAGAIGLGGAIAISGGFISIVLIIIFGYLTKLSLDLVIRLSIETPNAHGSYEDLASIGLGSVGRTIVMTCKLVYSFGCLVAYIVVLKDNFGPAIKHLLYYNDDEPSKESSWVYEILSSNAYFTWIVSTLLILPLCMLRNMTPLAKFSIISIISMALIVVIVVYIYIDCPEIRVPPSTFYINWIEIRPGIFESLGTFVFTFVSQHTVHLVFGSLKPQLQTLSNWKIVSKWALSISTFVSLTVGVTLYITFWQNTQSDIFDIYPQSYLIDISKLLLCITMILTFPLPFFTCRELIIVTFVHPLCNINHNTNTTNINDDENENENNNDLRQPLLPNDNDDENNMNNANEVEEGRGDVDDNDVDQQYQEELLHTSSMMGNDTSSVVSELSRIIVHTATPKNWLLPDDDKQLQLVGHMSLTGKLWIVATGLAIAAPSLGDVLDLVGCATGTIIAFILPGLLSIRIEGYSILGVLLLFVGVIVGIVGTYYSIEKLISDF